MVSSFHGSVEPLPTEISSRPGSMLTGARAGTSPSYLCTREGPRDRCTRGRGPQGLGSSHESIVTSRVRGRKVAVRGSG